MVPKPFPPAGSRSDVVLLDAVRADDSQALDEAIRRYWEPLLAYAEGFAGDRDTAEDGVQETFIRLWSRRHEWSKSDSLKGLLFRMLRNDLLNRQRSLRRRIRWFDKLGRQPAARPSTPDQLLAAKDLSAAVGIALDSLPERQREAFVLVRQAGLSYRETAEVMGISPQTVANQMSGALAALRKSLAPFLRTEEPPTLQFPVENRAS